jgi:hypothetical protein
MSYGEAVRWADFSEERLAIVAKARGYAKGWAWHCLREREAELDEELARRESRTA